MRTQSLGRFHFQGQVLFLPISFRHNLLISPSSSTHHLTTPPTRVTPPTTPPTHVTCCVHGHRHNSRAGDVAARRPKWVPESARRYAADRSPRSPLHSRLPRHIKVFQVRSRRPRLFHFLFLKLQRHGGSFVLTADPETSPPFITYTSPRRQSGAAWTRRRGRRKNCAGSNRHASKVSDVLLF